MTAVLIGGGSIENYDYYRHFFADNPVVICCDGGVLHAQKWKVAPHYVMGDFDSAPTEVLEVYRHQAEIIQYPIEKDYTDMELGLLKAIDLGAEEIIILGGTGSRFDHTLMNAHILYHAEKKGIRAYVINENNKITMVKGRYIFTAEKGEWISLIPFTENVTIVKTEGLYYPLQNEILTIGTSLGISNYLTGEEAAVEVGSGYLLVIISKD